MRFDQTQIITSGDMSGSLTSIGIDINQMFGYTVQAVWTGSSPTGTFKLQISNDMVNDYMGSSNPAANVTNWTDYSGSSQAITASGDFAWIVSDSNYKWVRLVYTRTSGTGTLNAILTAKGV